MKKLILDIAKVIGAVATIGGAAIWLYSTGDKAEDRHNETMQQLEYINVEQGMMAGDIDGIKDSVKKIETKMDAIVVEQEIHHDAIDNLGWIIRQDNLTEEQVEELLDRALKKNGDLTVYNETLSTDSLGIN